MPVTSEVLAGRAVPSGSRPGRGDRQAGVRGALRHHGLSSMSAPYLLDGDDLDAELAWATWTPGADGAPDPEVRYPPAEYRCRVPIGDVVRLAGQRPVWRFDRSADQWLRLGEDPGARPQPMELLLVNAADGGYDPETGFDPSAPGPVRDSPELLTPAEIAERAAAARSPRSAPARADGAAPLAVARRAQRAGPRPGRGAARRARAEHPAPGAARATIVAATCTTRARRTRSGRTRCARWPMSPTGDGRSGPPVGQVGQHTASLEFAGGARFRHELASLLLLDGPLRPCSPRHPTPTSPGTWSSPTTACSASRSANRTSPNNSNDSDACNH